MSAAAVCARRQRLPLVLICHDDYEDTTPSSFHPRLAAIYRQAAVRLCVSHPMASEFERRYGGKGDVLYPIPSGPAIRPVIERCNTQLRIGVAGGIALGCEDALVRLANAVGAVNGQIVVLSATSRKSRRPVWSHPAVTDLGQVSPERVGALFRQAGVNALAVVQSFDPLDERAFRFNFPSKLTEYSTFGLPLLIVAPESASAVTWARARGDVAVISSESPSELTRAVNRLLDPDARFELARAFYNVAVEFAPDRLQTAFEGAISSALSASLSRHGESARVGAHP